MSNYKAQITKNAEGDYCTYIVRIDYDGQESVDNCYKLRHFSSLAAAAKSTAKYMRKHGY